MELYFDKKDLEKIEALLNLNEERIDSALYEEEMPDQIRKLLTIIKQKNELEKRIKDIEQNLFIKNMEIDSIFELTTISFSRYDTGNIIVLLRNIIMGQVGIHKLTIFRKKNNSIEILERRGIKTGNDLLKRIIKKNIKDSKNDIIAKVENEEQIKDDLDYFFYIRDNTNIEQGIGIITGKKISENSLDDSDIDFIETILKQGTIILENIQMYKSVLEKERMEKELQIAKRIQKRMLPKNKPKWDEIKVDALNLSSYQVGGDLYDFIENENSIFITIGDVSGKGVSASLIMASAQASIRSFLSNSDENISKIMKKVNSVLLSITRTEMYLSFFLIKIDKRSKKVEYYNAGHLPGIYLKPNKEIEELTKGSYFLGMFDQIKGESEKIPFEKLGKIILYTDGVSEFEIQGKEIGIEGVKKLVKEHDGNISKIKEVLIQQKSAQRLKDDLTLLSLEFKT